ncbi:MAG TPA: Crp/Fnr family transcriptional regulator [Pedococcus sp.]|nr:Crp/Fnr family transcriptional regulator [Pedococcus sp.]
MLHWAMQWQLLDDLPDDVRRQVLARMQRRAFARGDVLFHEGDPADTLHLLAQGRVLARRTTPLGDSAAFRVIGPGRALGDVSLPAAHARRSSTVVALEPTVTLVMTFAEFRRLMAQYPVIGDRLAALLSARVRRLSEQLVEALYLSSDRRVVHRLLDLCDQYADGAAGTVVIPLTQTDLAQLAGAARPTTNRVLRALEADRILRLHRGRIEVIDHEALARLRTEV